MKSLASLVWLSACALLVCGILQARTIHIPAEKPKIQEGIEMAVDGDTVLVAPGSYVEHLDFLGKNIVVTSSGGSKVTFLSSYYIDLPTVLFGSGEPPTAELSGFTFKGFWALDEVTYVIDVRNGAGPLIKNNVFRHLGEPLFNLPRIVIHGVQGCEPIITRNLFYAVLGEAIQLSAGKVVNNTFSNCEVAIRSEQCSLIVFNNIVSTQSFGVIARCVRLDYNTMWKVGLPYGMVRAQYGLHEIWEDPLFTDPVNGDYTLRVESPCIDAGNPDPEYNDLDGTRGDMGAFPRLHELPAPRFVFHTYGTLTPEIYWSPYDTVTGVQEQYQVQVGTDRDWTTAETWDTGPVPSSDTSVVYSGSPLREFTYYYVRVRIHNGQSWGGWVEGTLKPQLTNVIHVPGNLQTIQEAIDYARYGDSIAVAPGKYTENLDIKRKTIKLVSSHGPDLTFLEPSNPGDTIINLSRVDSGMQFSGFSVKGGTLETPVIWIDYDSYPLISHNIFHDNLSSGPVIGADDVSPTIAYNLFYRNKAGCCVVIEPHGSPQIINNTFSYNDSCLSGQRDSGYARSNIFANTKGFAVEGNTWGMQYNVFWNNHPDFTGGLWPGFHNIFRDPLFYDSPRGDCYLRYDSPARDGGDPDPRYNDPDGTRNDIGAFPYGASRFPLAIDISYGPASSGMFVSDPQPEIHWKYFDTAVTTQQQFEIQVGTDHDWSQAELWRYGPVTSSDTTVQYEGPPLAYGLECFLRLRVHDGTQWGDWTERPLVLRPSVIHVPADQPTIQEAIRFALPADTVLVAPGTYHENIDYLRKPLTVVSSDGPEVTILQSTDHPDTSAVAINNVDGKGVGFRGFTVVGGRAYTSLSVVGDVEATVEDNVFAGYTGAFASVAVAGAKTRATVRRNLFYDNAVRAILIASAPALVTNNTFFNNTVGILGSCGNPCLARSRVLNNLVVQPTGKGIDVAVGQFEVVDYNDVWVKDGSFSWWPEAGEHNLLSDPRLKDPLNHDFRLMPGSPCIDAGSPDTMFNDPDGSRCDIGAIPFDPSTGVNDGRPPLPREFSLLQNYPNPFNLSTVIEYRLPVKSRVTINVYNLLGQRVTTLTDGEQPAGIQRVFWNGTNREGEAVASGVYFFKMEAGDFVQSRKMLLLK